MKGGTRWDKKQQEEKKGGKSEMSDRGENRLTNTKKERKGSNRAIKGHIWRRKSIEARQPRKGIVQETKQSRNCNRVSVRDRKNDTINTEENNSTAEGQFQDGGRISAPRRDGGVC